VSSKVSSFIYCLIFDGSGIIQNTVSFLAKSMSLRTKSSVWEFFIRCPNGEDKMVCKLCNSILSGRNASNAKKHLRYSHRSDYEKVVGQDRANSKKQVDDKPIEHSCSTAHKNLAGNNTKGTILDMK
jgi:hypothetical protein